MIDKTNTCRERKNKRRMRKQAAIDVALRNTMLVM